MAEKQYLDYEGLSHFKEKIEEIIPDAVTESTVSGWGFIKNTGASTRVNADGSVTLVFPD